MSDWRPMETAPKDGTRVILGRADRVDVAGWQEWPREHWSPEANAASRGWVVAVHTDSGWPDDIFDDPQGWQPMPVFSEALK